MSRDRMWWRLPSGSGVNAAKYGRDCRGRCVCAATSTLLAFSLAGCAPTITEQSFAGTGSGLNADGGSAAPTPIVLRGSVRAGAAAIGNAGIAIYAASAAAGVAPSLLTQAQSNTGGEFQLSVACPSNSAASPLIYVIATGGAAQPQNASARQLPSNAAIRLMAILGTCDRLPGAVTIDELTTIAAVYALNAFIDADAADSIAGGSPGLTNAAATAALLADPGSGALAASLPSAAACSAQAPPANCAAVWTLNVLADAVASCTGAASANSSTCANLFACATPGASTAGSGHCTAPADAVPPTDTAQAILGIARNPGSVSAAGLYGAAAGSSAYAPVLAIAPNDWSLSLNFTGGGLSEPTALAIDAAGNIWIANYNDAVTELSATGAALSPGGGFTGGGIEESFGIAIDAAGHVWICNEQSGAVNSGRGSITELAADGAAMSGAGGFAGGGLNFPQTVALDAAGHVWATNFGDSTLTELSSDGAPLSPDSGFAGGGLSFPVDLAVDASGNLWVANQGTDRISEFSAAGAPLSPAGYTGGGLAVPQGIAVDQANNVWASNYYGDSVSEFNARGAPLSPAAGYTAGGLVTPGGIAIDGAGHVWVANYRTASISELAGTSAGAPGTALSPATGFTASSLLQPFAVAIDPSGNLWVSNFGNDSVTEFIGIAAPVATPSIGVPHAS